VSKWRYGYCTQVSEGERVELWILYAGEHVEVWILYAGEQAEVWILYAGEPSY
jgi:hypothetical protein